MRELYALEVAALAQELNETLSSFRIEKFYETAKGTFRMRLSKPGAKANVLCAIPYTVNSTEYSETAGPATSFSMAMRKRISGFTINRIEQFNNDRILRFSLHKGAELVYLIMEMFGRGNLVLTNPEMDITLAYQLHKFKDREISPKSKYVPPKNDATLPTDESAVINVLSNLRKSPSNALALPALHRKVSMGTPYLENAFVRAGIDPNSAITALAGDDIASLARAISTIASECIASPKPVIYSSGEELLDFAIMHLSKYANQDHREFQTIQAMLDEAYVKTRPEAEQPNPEVETLRASISKQERLIVELEENAKASKAAGEAIFRHMNEINSILASARTLKRATKEELQHHAGNLKIVAVDLKSKHVTIEVS